jgi:NodT family efflux transporter outer membrane factor (OMF) lipoprotein
MRAIVAVSICFALLTGCAVGPNYKRPAVPTPPQYRQPVKVTESPDKGSLADLAWPELFQDEVLTKLVKTALVQSNDLEASTQRVIQARAQLGIQRSQFYPQVTASGNFTGQRSSSIGSFVFLPSGTPLGVSYTQAGINLSWELDLWGRLRRLNEAARAQYLASEEARHGVIASLIADVLTTYLSLREFDLELEIGHKTRDLAENGLRLTQLRQKQGVVTALDVRQAEQLLYTATAQIASTERSIAETENQLSLLLGQNPSDIPRGKPLVEIMKISSIPAGLPSSLLERRPDIRQAEQTLISYNAQIGAARAEFFPQITLTGLLGLQARGIGNLFTAPARNQNISPAALLPIFEGGRIRNNVRLTEAQQRESLANYRRTIQTAFEEVSNALADYQKFRQQREQEELLVKALQDTDRLSNLRYKGGLDSFLQVLDAERNEFSGELTLAQLRKNELLSIVKVYRALGGGWRNP